VGLAPSTVRFHLEILRGAGLVIRQPRPRGGIGRPRTTYAAVWSRRAAGYEDLAGLLAANLSRTVEQRRERAERIGEQWSRQLIPARAGAGATIDQAVVHIRKLFDDMGFAPQLTTAGDLRTIALHACPFRSLARTQPEVICAVHRGLLRGSLQLLGAASEGQLLPFIEPDLCEVHIETGAMESPV